tara:strand:+ start:1710 stop:2183 length:474 start_codon:yes stop_codon:yes gene_type:complete
MNGQVDSGFLLEVLKLEYNSRLKHVLGETAVFDDDGNLLVQPDLKVRHKKSGYEYTVDKVLGDKPGAVQIVLRDPTEPRFNPPPEGAEIIGGLEDEVLSEEDDLISKNVAAIDNLHSSELEIDSEGEIESTSSPDPAEDEVVFVVDQSEFEKEYEVD